MKQLPQVQCPNCKGFKTTKDSKKSHTLATGSLLFFGGIFCTLFFMWFIGVPLMIIGFITMAVAHNTMKEDGSMECRNCKLKFTTEIANIESPKIPWWKYQK